jgi:predicted nucleic acid-binding protein
VAAFVLDASVLAALYVEEPASEEAEAPLTLGCERAEADAPELVLLAGPALPFAMARGLTACDAAYCADATRIDATLMTKNGDRRRRATAAGVRASAPADPT